MDETPGMDEPPKIDQQDHHHKYKKINESEKDNSNITRKLTDASKLITKPVQKAGSTTKKLMKGTAVAVKDVASGVYEGVTGATAETRRERRVNKTDESSHSNGSRLSRIRDHISKRKGGIKKGESLGIADCDVVEGNVEANEQVTGSKITQDTDEIDMDQKAKVLCEKVEPCEKLENSDPEGKSPLEEGIRIYPQVGTDSSLHKAAARTTKAIVAPIENFKKGFSNMVPKSKISSCNTDASAEDRSNLHSSSDISESTNATSVRTNTSHHFRWINQTARNGIGKLRRNKKRELEEYCEPPTSVEVPVPQIEVHVCDHKIWKIEMSPTLEFLLHDTTIAVAVLVSIFSIPTFRYYSLVVQGHIPTSVHVSWLLLAFTVGIEMGRILGMRAAPDSGKTRLESDATMSVLSMGATQRDVPHEILFEVKKPAPTKEGYTLLYYFAAPYHQIQVVFPKKTTEKMTLEFPPLLPLLSVSQGWSTLGEQGTRCRQPWEIGGFVRVADPLMNRLLKNPDMNRKKLKNVVVEEHDTELTESGHVPAQLLGEIPIQEMAAESLENDVIDPCFKLRGMDLFLTDAAEEDMSSHPFLLKHGLRDKPTLIVNALVQWANVCLYFQLPDWFTDFDEIVENDDDPADVKATKRFLSGDDAYRDARFKILPCLVDGPLPVRIMAPPKKELLISSRALPSKWKKHRMETLSDGTILQPILEMEIDVISNSAIRGISAMLKRHIKSVALDLAVVIQTPNGQKEKEPEACLGLWRFDHIDVLTCPPLPPRVDQQHQDLLKASQFMQIPEAELAAINEESSAMSV